MTVSHSELRFEKFEIGGSGGYEIPYFWDGELEEWLSCNELIISAGRNSNNYIGWLRGTFGPMYGQHGWEIPHDCKATWLQTNCNQSQTPLGILLDIYNNNSLIRSEVFGDRVRTTLNLDVNQGILSFELVTSGNPAEIRPNTPWLLMGLRYKLP